MPNLNPLHKASLEVGDNLFRMRQEAEKAKPIPFGQQQVSWDTWERRFLSKDTPVAVRRQMIEGLGPDKASQLAALGKRFRKTNTTPFGGTK